MLDIDTHSDRDNIQYTNSDTLMLDIDKHSDRDIIQYTNSDTLMLDIDTHSFFLKKNQLLKPLNMTTEVCVSNGLCFPPHRYT